jgi:hypothetical protein
MAETRKLLQTVLSNQRIHASPPLRTAIQTALRSRRKLTAPLIPLGPEQRLGWLDEVDELTCEKPLQVKGDAFGEAFSTGKSYRIASKTVATQDIITRQTVAGFPEEVAITGTELVVTIRDNALRIHIFAHHTPPHDPRIHKSHPLDTLLHHFLIPPVHDIATIFPARFQKLKTQLAAL